MVFGITGGTGAGKTTALGALTALGACVIDCDAVYHRLLLESQEMLSAIDAEFPGVVTDGALDRKALGRVVFSSEEALNKLSGLTHPFVIAETERIVEQGRREGYSHFAIDAIGLFESGADKLCDVTVFVTAPRMVRARRIMAREGIDEAYALMRIDAQKPDEYFEALCDITLVNDFTSEAAFSAYARAVFHKIINDKEK